MTAVMLQHIPIHFVSGELTVCGMPISREMAMTHNPRRTTCRRCTSTLAYKRALSGLRRHNNGGKKFTQPPLFAEVG